MIERAYIHVGGPEGGGKTTFAEAVLGETGAMILVARCVRDDALRRSRETAPSTNQELHRYRRAGAVGAALFAFPKSDIDSDVFFETDLISGFSEGVVVDGDNPLRFVDLDVFVAPAPRSEEALLVRRTRDLAAEDRANIEVWERQLRRPDGVAEWLSQQIGGAAVELARKKPELFDDARNTILAGLAEARKAPTRKPVTHWAIADPYSGIEHAGLVVVNVRHDSQREDAERFTADVLRIRKDEEVFGDILSFRGSRTPITAVVANLAEPADPGRKKAMARVKRTLRARSVRSND